jgi:hypothetical protein
MRREEDHEMIRERLDVMPFDHEFNGELCHATGYEVFLHGEWWNEYEDSEGELHYGR